jgi:hypothetical protein
MDNLTESNSNRMETLVDSIDQLLERDKLLSAENTAEFNSDSLILAQLKNLSREVS